MDFTVGLLAGQIVGGTVMYFVLGYFAKKRQEKFEAVLSSLIATAPYIQNIRDDLADQKEWNR